MTGVLLFWAPPFRQWLDLEDEPWDPNHGDGSPSLWERVRSGRVAALPLWSEVVTRLGQGLQTGGPGPPRLRTPGSEGPKPQVTGWAARAPLGTREAPLQASSWVSSESSGRVALSLQEPSFP